MEYILAPLGGIAIILYLILAVGLPILLILSPIMIWLNIRRGANALDRIVVVLEKLQTRVKPPTPTTPPPVKQVNQKYPWLDS
jgi:hypothetical protein